MKPRSQKHVHKYQRRVIGKDYIVYACALPECTHYISEALVEGKLTICWRCGEMCQMRRDNRGNFKHKPHCIQCTHLPRNKNLKKKPEVTATATALAAMLAGSTKVAK